MTLSLVAQGLAIQAASIPEYAKSITRIVRGSELFHDVFLEAIQAGAFVFTNGKRTVIAMSAPSPDWVKVDHSVINSLGDSHE